MLSDLLMDAANYPPTLAIAARLHLEGYSVQDFVHVCKLPQIKQVPQATKDNVIDHLREIKTGERKIDTRLQELAMILIWPG